METFFFPIITSGHPLTHSIHTGLPYVRHGSDGIFDRIVDGVEELLGRHRVVGEDMIGHHPPGGFTHPLEQREVLELVGLEDLEHLDGLVVAEVLDEVAHVAGDDPDVAGHEVERAGGPVGGEDGDPGPTRDEEGPLVGVGVPVHLPHGPRADVEVGGGDGLADGEVGRVGDPDEPAGGVEGFLVQHLVGELESGLLDVGAPRFLVLDRPRDGPLEDVLFGLGDRLEHLRRQAEVLGQDGFGRVD